jgi:hypothetical protein
MPRQPLQTTVAEASRTAPEAAGELLQLADGFQANAPGEPLTSKHWRGDARTFVCHTHIEIPGVKPDRFIPLVHLFYHQASLPRQPWYAEFLGGSAMHCDLPPEGGTLRQQLATGCFDLHVGKPRCYRQLVSLHSPLADTRVIVARSVDAGPDLQGDAVLTHTLDPNGEVLRWRSGALHWHHICTTPGAAVLPRPLDRWLINALRASGLDSAERGTYAREALSLAEWVTADGFDADVAALRAAMSTPAG